MNERIVGVGMDGGNERIARVGRGGGGGGGVRKTEFAIS